jgi:hypothetical protein
LKKLAFLILGLTFWSYGVGCFSVLANDETGVHLSRVDSVYISYIHEICNVSAEFGNDIWPGLDYNDIPILIYRPDTIAFLFNHPDPPAEFEPATEIPWNFKKTVYKFEGRFRNFIGQFWIWEDINGLATLVCPYGDDEGYEQRFFLFVIHEAFHTFQASHFADRGDSQEEYYPLTILENNALATLENLILAQVAEAMIDNQKEKIAGLARQFAVIREHRYRKAPPFVRNHERVKERLENTAFFVEKRFQEAGKRPGYAPTNFLRYARFDPYIERAEVLKALRDGIEGHVQNGAIVPMAMPRYRIYDNGATIGYLLDFLDIDWKERVASDSAFLFHHPLIEHFNISPDQEEQERTIETIKQEYDFGKILAAAELNINEYAAELSALEEKIRKSGRNEYVITINTERSFSRSKRGTKRVLYADEGHVTLIEGIDQFLMKNKTASVSIRNKGLIYYLPEDEKTRVVRLFTDQLPAGIHMDGKEISFAQGDYSFESSLLLEIGDLLEIRGQSGRVVVNPGKVEIFLD